MRAYLTWDNFRTASALGLAGTLMAAPRILLSGQPAGILIPGAFAALTLTGGAVTAWSRHAGMAGWYAGGRATRRALAAVAVLVIGFFPAQHGVLDPLLRKLLSHATDARWVELQMPASFHAWLALALWCAGFQTLVFTAGPMAFFARLTGRLWVAIALTAAFHIYAMTRAMTQYGVDGGSLLLAAGAVVGCVFSCLLFARGGLLPAAAFAAGMQVHLLWLLGNR